MLKPNKLAKKNFLSSLDLSANEVLHILELASNFKNQKINIDLDKKVLGLIFDKSSTRTRVSFQVAMTRLGLVELLLTSILQHHKLEEGSQ